MFCRLIGEVLDEMGGLWFIIVVVVVILFISLLCWDLIELFMDWNVLDLKLNFLNLVINEFLVEFFEMGYLNFLGVLMLE